MDNLLEALCVMFIPDREARSLEGSFLRLQACAGLQAGLEAVVRVLEDLPEKERDERAALILSAIGE